jgi:hypothetical protein
MLNVSAVFAANCLTTVKLSAGMALSAEKSWRANGIFLIVVDIEPPI